MRAWGVLGILNSLKCYKSSVQMKWISKKLIIMELINDKIAASKDGMIYLNDTDFRTIMEAAREDDAGKAHEKEQQKIGANLDLKA